MKKVKQISALVCIILLVLMYIALGITAVFASDKAPGLFLTGVFLTIVIPILIYGFVEVYKFVHRDDKKNDDEETEEKDK